ncbi:YT521-B-like domain-containing protein [Triangularia verruculosa]|uniref:YT521-B-like domain-containing protein n=1 Tax=Triangularia verruculosa TaxID=2587418 RepID=A0AAN7ATS0_9PEZI|nr:YT521-B-like domain-containing protein [Triangularia verruculosa]
MASTPQPPDMKDLGAKTAALRAKLEQSRRKSHSRQSSTYIPHQLPPKRPANISLEATDDDIQDLITSIRVTSGGVNEDGDLDPFHQSYPKQKEVPSTTIKSSQTKQQAYPEQQGTPSATFKPLPNRQQANAAKTVTSSVNQEPDSSASDVLSKNQQAYIANSQVYTGVMQPPSSTFKELVPSSQKLLSTDSQAIQELVDRVPDIKDWLEMTDYHNPETRTIKLDRFRRLRNLAAEKQRLEEEERRLLEEQEHDFRPQQRQAKVAPLLTHVQPVATETRQSLPTPITPNKPVAEDDSNSLVLWTSKRAHPEEGAAQQGRDKVPRADSDARMEGRKTASSEGLRRTDSTDDHAVSVYSRQHDTAERSSSRYDAFERPPSRYDITDHPLSRRCSYREPSRPRPDPGSPPRGPRKFDNSGPRPFRQGHGDGNNAGETRSRYDSYKGPSAREFQRRHSTFKDREGGESRRLDLGRRGDTRFFIVKSFNDENVRQCMEDNLWTTQAHNSAVFAEAFEQCKNVILFFSINQSGHFQGYARMVTPPSDEVPRPAWMRGLHWESGEPFALEWLSTTPIEFSRIRWIRNSLNDSQVFFGKDGQEIEFQAGVDLLREMDLVREREQEQERTRWEDHPRRGGYHGSMVKQESTP